MNNKGLYTEYFKEAKKASEITTASMIVMDYLGFRQMIVLKGRM